MDKILTALGGVALGVAAYTLGEIVQERRAERGEEYGILDLFEDWINGEDDGEKTMAREKVRVEDGE